VSEHLGSLLANSKLQAVYEVSQAVLPSADLTSLLAAGWEPFGVFAKGSSTVIVLRRTVSETWVPLG